MAFYGVDNLRSTLISERARNTQTPNSPISRSISFFRTIFALVIRFDSRFLLRRMASTAFLSSRSMKFRDELLILYLLLLFSNSSNWFAVTEKQNGDSETWTLFMQPDSVFWLFSISAIYCGHSHLNYFIIVSLGYIIMMLNTLNLWQWRRLVRDHFVFNFARFG